MANSTHVTQGPSGLLLPGLPVGGAPQEVFLHDGRQLSGASDPERSMEEHGFCLVSGVPTTLPMSAFSEHFTKKAHKGICQTFTFSGSSAVPGDIGCFTSTADGPAALETSEAVEAIAQYQQETASAVKKAFPRAELLFAYNQVVRTSRGTSAASSGESSVSPSVPGPQDAGAIAATIRGGALMVQYYPEASLAAVRKMLLHDGNDSGYLDSLVTYHSSPKPYAAMAGASRELQARVREALPEQDFIAQMKGLLRGEQAASELGGQTMSDFKSREDGNFEPPALSVHTDITEDFAVKQLHKQAAWEALHTFRADRYAVYHLNLWRNINPEEDIRNYHLAVLDKSSVAKEDALPRDLTFDGYTLEQYSLRFNPAHQWVYYPSMTSDEILMFHQSKCLMLRGAGEGSAAAAPWAFSRTGDERPQSVFHTAVTDPGAPEGAERDSCENRFIVFVPIEDTTRSAL